MISTDSGESGCLDVPREVFGRAVDAVLVIVGDGCGSDRGLTREH